MWSYVAVVAPSPIPTTGMNIGLSPVSDPTSTWLKLSPSCTLKVEKWIWDSGWAYQRGARSFLLDLLEKMFSFHEGYRVNTMCIGAMWQRILFVLQYLSSSFYTIINGLTEYTKWSLHFPAFLAATYGLVNTWYINKNFMWEHSEIFKICFVSFPVISPSCILLLRIWMLWLELHLRPWAVPSPQGWQFRKLREWVPEDFMGHICFTSSELFISKPVCEREIKHIL